MRGDTNQGKKITQGMACGAKGKNETIKEYDARIKAQLRALKDQRGVSTTR